MLWLQQIEVMMPGSDEVSKSICIADVGKLYDRASGFHDATLKPGFLTVGDSLSFIITNIWWSLLHESYAPDKTTQIFFQLNGVVLSDSWGSDDSICRCCIYDFELQERYFKLLTGDGGRSGTFDESTSSVKIITTATLVAEYGLPI